MSEKSKAEQLYEFMEEMWEPAAAHLRGRCRECRSEVWICTSIRPSGMGRSCEEHEPLCCLQVGPYTTETDQSGGGA